MTAYSLNMRLTCFRAAAAGIALIAMTLSMSGCKSTYGKIAANPVIGSQYQERSLPVSYQYYYSGRSGLPDAVVGIVKTYRFQGRFWTRIHTMDNVYEKIEDLSTIYPDAGRMRAADILDHTGHRIGVWFSYTYTTPVRIDQKNGMVELYTDTSTRKTGR